MGDGEFEYRFKVPLHDIDAAGIMFFGHLFRHAHDAYEAFMGAIGFPLDQVIREGSWRLPLVHAEADYRLPLRHGDKTTVRLSPSKVGHSSFVLDYRFIGDGGQLSASARTVHAQMAADGAAAVPLAEPLWAALSARLVDHGRDQSSL
jgi:1,4-dihydroxy-2-naphthoyl-CoA hydrolase